MLHYQHNFLNFIKLWQHHDLVNYQFILKSKKVKIKNFKKKIQNYIIKIHF